MVRNTEFVEEECEELVVNTKIRGGHALLGGDEFRKQAMDMLTEDPHESNFPISQQGTRCMTVVGPCLQSLTKKTKTATNLAVRMKAAPPTGL